MRLTDTYSRETSLAHDSYLRTRGDSPWTDPPLRWSIPRSESNYDRQYRLLTHGSPHESYTSRVHSYDSNGSDDSDVALPERHTSRRDRTVYDVSYGSDDSDGALPQRHASHRSDRSAHDIGYDSDDTILIRYGARRRDRPVNGTAYDSDDPVPRRQAPRRHSSRASDSVYESDATTLVDESEREQMRSRDDPGGSRDSHPRRRDRHTRTDGSGALDLVRAPGSSSDVPDPSGRREAELLSGQLEYTWLQDRLAGTPRTLYMMSPVQAPIFKDRLLCNYHLSDSIPLGDRGLFDFDLSYSMTAIFNREWGTNVGAIDYMHVMLPVTMGGSEDQYELVRDENNRIKTGYDKYYGLYLAVITIGLPQRLGNLESRDLDRAYNSLDSGCYTNGPRRGERFPARMMEYAILFQFRLDRTGRHSFYHRGPRQMTVRLEEFQPAT